MAFFRSTTIQGVSLRPMPSPLLITLLILLIEAFYVEISLSESPECPDEIWTKWMEDSPVNRNRTGTRENPFNEFQEVINWLDGLNPGFSCNATLWMMPGIYLGEQIVVRIPMTVINCADCPGPSYAAGDVIFSTSELDDPLFMVQAPLTLINVTLYGYESDSYLQWREVSQKLRQKKFSLFDASETSIDLSTFETRLVQPIMNPSLIMVLRTSLQLYNVALSRHSRRSSLIDCFESNVMLHEVTGILNYRMPGSSSALTGGTVLSGIATSVSISSSFFMRNMLEVSFQISQSTGGGVLSLSGKTLSITSTEFSFNTAVFDSTRKKGSVSFCGGAIRTGDDIDIYISDSEFNGNSVADFTNEMFTNGGAICIGRGTKAIVKDSQFLRNAADIGAAIGQLASTGHNPTVSWLSLFEKDAFGVSKTSKPIVVEKFGFGDSKTEFRNLTHVMGSDSARSTLLHLKSVIASKNTCYIRGCAFSLSPSGEAAHWIIEDSVISNNYFFANSTKLCPNFTNPISQLEERRELSGGIGISFFVRSTIPFPTSLVMKNVTMQRNVVQNWESCVLGGGAAISTFGAERVSLSNSIISDHYWNGDMNGVIWVRQFKSFDMMNSNMTNNWIQNWISPVSPILDLQSDSSFLISDVEYSVAIQGVTFDNNTAAQTIYIADVQNVLLSNVLIMDSNQGAGLDGDSTEMAQSYLLITNVVQKVEIDGLISERPPLPHRLSYIGQLQISNSRFDRYYTFLGPNEYHLSLDTVNRAIFSNSSFSDNLSGALRVVSSHLEVNLCKFVNNHCVDNGCALQANGAFIWMEESLLHSNMGSNGAAMSMTSSEAFVIRTTFEKNLANAIGGAIYASQSSLFLQSMSCIENYALYGGCLAMDVSTLNSVRSEDRFNFVSFDSDFLHNRASNAGGAIYLRRIPNIQLVRGRMENNIAEREGGGAVSVTSGHVNANGIYCVRNFAGYLTQGSSTQFDSKIPQKQPLPDSLLISGTGLSGGAFLLSETTISLVNATFESNGASLRAGAIYFQHATGNNITMQNVVFSQNHAQVAGAVSFDIRKPLVAMDAIQSVLNNVSFIRNQASYGGAIEYAPLQIPTKRDHPLFDKPSNSNDDDDDDDDDDYHLNFEPSNIYQNQEFKPAIHISNALFFNNQAIGSGGAIYTKSTQQYYFDYQNLSFIDNSALTSGGTFFWRPHGCQSTPPNFCDPSSCIIEVNSTGIARPSLWGPVVAAGTWHFVPAALIDIKFNNGSIPYPDNNNLEIYSTHSGSTSSIGFGRELGDGEAVGDGENVPNFPKKSQIWDGHFGLDTSGLKTAINVSVYYDEYLLKLGYEDCYGQHVLETQYALRANHFESHCESEEVECPVVQIIDGMDSFRVLVFANESNMEEMGPYRPNVKNPASVPVNVFLTIYPTVAVKTYDWEPEEHAEMKLNLEVSRCGVGSGLQTSSLRDLAICDICPINTYNHDGNGKCYLCNDWSETATVQLSCAGSTVSFMEDYWATAIQNSNALFVGRCPLGFCERGQCASERTGTLCGSCAPNSFESLFAFCSPSLCKSPNILFFILFFSIIAIVTTSMHASLLRWPIITMFVLYCSQMALMILHYPLDWAIPRATPWIASLLCGFRTDPITRSIFLNFAPFAGFGFLWLPWLCLQPLRFLTLRVQILFKSGAWFDSKRLIMSSFALWFILTSGVLKMVIDWFQCKETPLGRFWSPAPSIRCDSDEFRRTRLWIMIVGFPLAIIPLIASFLFVMTAKALPKWQTTLKTTFRVSSRTRQLFHFLQTYSPYWPVVEIVTRTLIPIILSLAPSREVLMSCILGIVFGLTVVVSIPLSPFLKPLQRYTATSALGLLAILGLFRVDLVYGKNIISPLLTLLFVCIFILSLILILIIGRPNLDTNALSVEGFEDFSSGNAWEKEIRHYSPSNMDHESEDESKSLLSFSSTDLQSDIDSEAEELVTDEEAI